MKTPQVIKQILKKGPMGVTAMAEKLQMSRQAIHRHLKVLLKNKEIKKEGEGPHVRYYLMEKSGDSRIQESYNFFLNTLLPIYLKRKAKTIQKNYEDFLKINKSALKSRDAHFAFMLDFAALYSSKIEGNTLNLNSFFNSRMTAKAHRPKEAQEIEDLVKAYKFSQTLTLNEQNMLKAHAMLSKEFVAKTRQGKYRQEPVGVFSPRGLEYLAIESDLVDTEMKVFFEQIQILKKTKKSLPEMFFWASWIHLTMALIHPFVDGNGRISRLCEKWFLSECLGLEAYLLVSEEHYFTNRPAYYRSLKLGANYWEVDFEQSMDFLEILPGSLKTKASY